MEEIWIFWNCLQADIFKACRTKISGQFGSMEVLVLTWHQVRSDSGRMTKIQPMYQYLRVNCYSPMKHVWPYSMKNLSILQSCQWLVAEIWHWWPLVTSFISHIMSHLWQKSRDVTKWIFYEFRNSKFSNSRFSTKWPHFILNDFIFPVKFTSNEKDLD